MDGFRCAQFPKPEYEALQRLRKDVLGGVTQRVAIATALRVTAEVVREGGVHRALQHCTEFRGTAPSEVEELLPAHAVVAARPRSRTRRSRRRRPSGRRPSASSTWRGADGLAGGAWRGRSGRRGRCRSGYSRCDGCRWRGRRDGFLRKPQNAVTFAVGLEVIAMVGQAGGGEWLDALIPRWRDEQEQSAARLRELITRPAPESPGADDRPWPGHYL